VDGGSGLNATVSNFDYIVFGLLLVSALLGFARGAVREIVAVTALVAAALAAVFGWEFVRPFVAHVVHTRWMAAVASLLLVFMAVFVALRIVGAGLARSVQRADVLGALDRTVGLLIGLVRGFVVLGAFYLMFNAATPPDLQPRWIVQARTWPLAADMGRLLATLEPRGLDLASRLRPAFSHAVREGGSGDRKTTEGYDARQRNEVDDLVERSR
jgi:membrane protein required for colicin V production